MARVRILKRQDRAYMELPREMAAHDEVEVFQLREGYYLLSVPLGQPSPRQEGGISEAEKEVLKKLLSIRFENRTPEHVSGALSEEELSVLKGLEGKGLVYVFRGGKYKEGVYSVKDSAYSLAKDKKGPEAGARAAGEGGRRQETAHVQSEPPQGGGAIVTLKSRGFVVVNDKREAVALSDSLGSDMKSGAVVGVKGFDGKFYIVTRSYFMAAQASIASVLKDDMDAPSIASAAKLDPEGCMAALRLMAENGDIIEKKRGVFAPV
ncbi:MAG: hypothetical protein AB1529_02860 [Candidatus Micrarchaeota archaeon]